MFKGLFAEMFAYVILLFLLLFVQHSEFNSGWRIVLYYYYYYYLLYFRAMFVNLPGLIMIVSLCCMIGVVMFAFYADCHPITYGVIDKTDQVTTHCLSVE